MAFSNNPFHDAFGDAARNQFGREDYVVNDKRRVKPEPEVTPKNHEQTKADMRVVHLLDQMAQAHAEFLYHKEKAEAALARGNLINQNIVKLVHKLAQNYTIVEHKDGPEGADEKRAEGRPPTNLEDILEELLGKMRR